MVWNPHTDKGIMKVDMVQRKAIRWTMNNFSSYASVTDMQKQHGFRDRRSFETRPASLSEGIAHKTIQGKQTDLILLDFSQVDTTNHSKLLIALL